VSSLRAVVQRVRRARVRVEGETVAEIGAGSLVLVGVAAGDDEADARYLAEKVAHLRIFADEQGKMNRSLLDCGGAALAVSQFTLYGDCRQGRRPSFTAAAAPQDAARLFAAFCQALADAGVPVATGRFQTAMQVELVNDGPVTMLLDRGRQF